MTIVFDFDGVIVRRSEFSKREAWKVVFDNDPKMISGIKKLSEKYSGGKGTRINILRDLFREEVGYGDRSDFIKQYSEKFNQVVQNSILSEGILPEDREALEKLSKKHKLFINTATPEEVIKITIEQLGIKNYFAGIYGMPTSKVDNLKKAALVSGVKMEDIVFVGDGENDYEASLEAGCKFIGVSNDWNNWQLDKKPFILVRGIFEIEALL